LTSALSSARELATAATLGFRRRGAYGGLALYELQFRHTAQAFRMVIVLVIIGSKLAIIENLCSTIQLTIGQAVGVLSSRNLGTVT